MGETQLVELRRWCIRAIVEMGLCSNIDEAVVNAQKLEQYVLGGLALAGDDPNRPSTALKGQVGLS